MTEIGEKVRDLLVYITSILTSHCAYCVVSEGVAYFMIN